MFSRVAELKLFYTNKNIKGCCRKFDYYNMHDIITISAYNYMCQHSIPS